MTILAGIGVTLGGALLLALVLIGLPGTWLLLAVCLVAEALSEESLFHSATLVVAFAIAAGGELLELTSASRGAKRAGASRAGTLAALGGGIVGAVAGTILVLIPIVGTLLGGMIGAFTFGTIAEVHTGKRVKEALRAGSGAAGGQMRGMLLKFGAGVLCWLLLSVAAFVP